MKVLEQKIHSMFQQDSVAFSDIHFHCGQPMRARVPRGVTLVDSDAVSQSDLVDLLNSLSGQHDRTTEAWQKLIDDGDGQFTGRFTLGKQAFRAALFNVEGGAGGNRLWALNLRVLTEKVADFNSLGLPDAVLEWFERPNGLIIFTGVTGSGKSTSMAAGIEYLNDNRQHRIIKLEDPIEYVHESRKSMISARELGADFTSFAKGVKQAVREDPDVIVVGEINDLESMRGALSAALTGHLVITSMHTVNAVETVSRIIEMYPAAEQEVVRGMIAQLLVGVVSQRLVPSRDGKKHVLAHEVMSMSPTIRTMIREDKRQQIPNEMNKRKPGMHLLNTSLATLVASEKISEEVALEMSNDPEHFAVDKAMLEA